MKKTIKLLISVILLPIVSCSQNSNHSLSDFRTSIYDTCHLSGDYQVPSEFWFDTDKNGDLNKNVDSVLFIQIRGGIDDNRLEELHRCSNLGFYEFMSSSSSSISKISQDRVDFKKFPELRYVHSDYLFSEKQFNDLLKTGKKINGLNIKINFPVPDCLCELDELRYLIITNYGGVTLPPCIKDMPNLKYLDIGGGVLGSDDPLNKTIWNIPSLELLTIHGGAHVNIQPSVKNMIHLKQLNISSVDSLSFPNEITELDSLEILTVSWVDKKICFPSNFNNLHGLKGIKLAQIRVNQLPVLSNHENIEYMNYAEVHELDSIKNLHFHFKKLPGLKHLWLSGNAFVTIKNIPKGIELLPSLESVQLIRFGFPHYNDFIKRINKDSHPIHFGGDFILTFDHYKWLFIYGKPAKFHPKMY